MAHVITQQNVNIILSLSSKWQIIGQKIVDQKLCFVVLTIFYNNFYTVHYTQVIFSMYINIICEITLSITLSAACSIDIHYINYTVITQHSVTHTLCTA